MRIAGVCTSPRDDDAIRQELEARGEVGPAVGARSATEVIATATSRSPTIRVIRRPRDPSSRSMRKIPTSPSATRGTTSASPTRGPRRRAAEETPDSADTAIDPSEDPDD